MLDWYKRMRTRYRMWRFHRMTKRLAVSTERAAEAMRELADAAEETWPSKQHGDD